MAKPFGKNVRQWFDNPSTHEFIETLAVARGIDPTVEKRTSLNTSALVERYPRLIKVVKGGLAIHAQGTWMHEGVAMEFARWISSKFAIWCNGRREELFFGNMPEKCRKRPPHWRDTCPRASRGTRICRTQEGLRGPQLLLRRASANLVYWCWCGLMSF